MLLCRDGRPERPTRDGNVETIRVLRIARTSAIKARAIALTQLEAVIKTVPEPLRTELGDLDGATLLSACRALHATRRPAPTPSPHAKRPPRPGRLTDPTAATTAGDNPHRITTSAAFAMLCGVAPIPASSGKTTNRHRLNRGGERHANCALCRIAMGRLRYDQRTQTYRDTPRSHGKTNKEAMRVIKRTIAREIYQAITTDLTTTPRTS